MVVVRMKRNITVEPNLAALLEAYPFVEFPITPVFRKIADAFRERCSVTASLAQSMISSRSPLGGPNQNFHRLDIRTPTPMRSGRQRLSGGFTSKSKPNTRDDRRRMRRLLNLTNGRGDPTPPTVLLSRAPTSAPAWRATLLIARP